VGFRPPPPSRAASAARLGRFDGATVSRKRQHNLRWRVLGVDGDYSVPARRTSESACPNLHTKGQVDEGKIQDVSAGKGVLVPGQRDRQTGGGAVISGYEKPRREQPKGYNRLLADAHEKRRSKEILAALDWFGSGVLGCLVGAPLAGAAGAYDRRWADPIP
jgi:hypothetical protein